MDTINNCLNDSLIQSKKLIGKQVIANREVGFCKYEKIEGVIVNTFKNTDADCINYKVESEGKMYNIHNFNVIEIR